MNKKVMEFKKVTNLKMYLLNIKGNFGMVSMKDMDSSSMKTTMNMTVNGKEALKMEREYSRRL
jgi:hypothetical protein